MQFSGGGFHAYLAGKDPLDCLGELADEIDMAATPTVGKGHFGEVKQARRRRDGLNVAVKKIPLRNVGPCVRREVQAMQDLAMHPNLVRLVDVYACRQPLPQEGPGEGPYICIVTEFVEAAESLARSIATGGTQPGLASRVMPQLAEALAFVHLRGYVHRDVWSENVLVKSNGSVVLVDFGASVRHHTTEVVTDSLNIPYAAPESSYRARQGVGEDCWAAGLLLSEIVTGKFLCARMGTSSIPAYSRSGVMNEVKNETTAIGGRVLGRLCTDLLHFDPAQRTAMKDVRAYFSSATSVTAPSTNSSTVRVSQGSTREPSRPATSTTPSKYSGTSTTPTSAWSPKRTTSPGPSSTVRRLFPDASPRGSGQMLGDVRFREFGSSTTANFEAGASVSYLARSNGKSYTGVVEGRSVDGKGWRLALHCGEIKLVPDSDAWRIIRLP
jgi:serine/threonine protein kinase